MAKILSEKGKLYSVGKWFAKFNEGNVSVSNATNVCKGYARVIGRNIISIPSYIQTDLNRSCTIDDTQYGWECVDGECQWVRGGRYDTKQECQNACDNNTSPEPPYFEPDPTEPTPPPEWEDLPEVTLPFGWGNPTPPSGGCSKLYENITIHSWQGWQECYNGATFRNCNIAIYNADIRDCTFINCNIAAYKVDIRDCKFVNCSANASLSYISTITNCIFENCGSIYHYPFLEGSTTTNCTFKDCSTASNFAHWSNPTNCTFENCSAGGEFLHNLTATNCTFKDCSAGDGFIASNSNATDCTFKDCSAEGDFFCSSNPTNCTFENCSTGGDFFCSSNPTNCTFKDCSAAECFFYYYSNTTDCIFENCTGGRLLSYHSNATNCTFKDCSTGEFIASSCSATNCTFENCSAGNFICYSSTTTDCTFKDCSAGGDFFYRYSNATDCIFENCSAGDEFFEQHSNATNCRFIKCKTSWFMPGNQHLIECSIEHLVGSNNECLGCGISTVWSSNNTLSEGSIGGLAGRNNTVSNLSIAYLCGDSNTISDCTINDIGLPAENNLLLSCVAFYDAGRDWKDNKGNKHYWICETNNPINCIINGVIHTCGSGGGANGGGATLPDRDPLKGEWILDETIVNAIEGGVSVTYKYKCVGGECDSASYPSFNTISIDGRVGHYGTGGGLYRNEYLGRGYLAIVDWANLNIKIKKLSPRAEYAYIGFGDRPVSIEIGG